MALVEITDSISLEDKGILAINQRGGFIEIRYANQEIVSISATQVSMSTVLRKLGRLRPRDTWRR
jgi:hypothetical protein